jgi:ribosomal-protein-alanine N-acetyltransferase
MIRSMQQDDIEAVMKIERLGFSHPWTEGIFRGCLAVGYRMFVLEKEQQIIGYGLTSIVLDECHILNLCIDPFEQQKGYGHYLLSYLLEDAKQQLAKMAYLEVRISNVSALRLYQHSGFEQIGIRKNYYPAEEGAEDAVVLRRCL